MIAVKGATFAAALVLALMAGCGHGTVPSSGVTTTPDARSELTIQHWETELTRVAREGCRFRNLQLACTW